jgi:tetratricopeptide (TPR) repeat protein
MKISLCCAMTVYILLAATLSRAQDPYNAPGTGVGPAMYESKGAVLKLTVYSKSRVHLDRQAVVKLYNKMDKSAQWRTTTSEAEVSFWNLTVGEYDLEISAVGYLTDNRAIIVGTTVTGYDLEIILKPDPVAIDLNRGFDSKVPSKPRKQIQRGVSALKSGDYGQAQKRLESAYRDAPTSPDVNFLLGYLFYQRNQFDVAQNFLGNAAKLDPRNAQTLSLLARMHLQQKEYGQAQTELERAIAVDDDYWLGHSLLADAYLRQNEFEKARIQAQLAIDRGKGGSSSAYLVLGQALANIGRHREAVQALQTYMQYAPKSVANGSVKDYIDQLEKRISNPDAAGSVPTYVANVSAGSLEETDDLRLSMKSWHPPGIDDLKPALASGVACPVETVINGAGERVKELVDDVARFAAIEEILHESLDELGQANARETRMFDYFVEISQSDPGSVNEYRSAHEGPADFPDQIATRGLPSLAMIFHPAMRDTFQMTCEGLGEWQGRAAWLVYFRQREDRPNRIRAYKVGDEFYSIDLKGRAWIASDKFQILHIESQLVSPLRTIKLLSEYQSVDYGPVSFPSKSTELWLPKNAELYFDFRRHRFHRRHSFDHFMLFSVDAQERPKDPRFTPVQPPQN